MDLSAWTPAAISLIPSHPHTFHTVTRPTLSHFLTYPTPSQVIWEYPGETKLQCTCWQFNRRMWYVLKHQLCMDGCMDPDILSDWFWISLMLRSEFWKAGSCREWTQGFSWPLPVRSDHSVSYDNNQTTTNPHNPLYRYCTGTEFFSGTPGNCVQFEWVCLAYNYNARFWTIPIGKKVVVYIVQQCETLLTQGRIICSS